jgi:mxaJ protein
MVTMWLVRSGEALLIAALALGGRADTVLLRVCADPDNRPLSHADGSGFEDRLAALLAHALGRTLQIHAQPRLRSYVRWTLAGGQCDVVIGVPAGYPRLNTTRPYYRAGWVFVTRADETPPSGFEDLRLKSLRVGVQRAGADGSAATPAALALTRQGIDGVMPFSAQGKGSVAERMLQALQERTIDVAVLWGPQAGALAAAAQPPLRMTDAPAPLNLHGQPFEIAIAVGVARGEPGLRNELQKALDEHRSEVDALLDAAHVPRLGGPAAMR